MASLGHRINALQQRLQKPGAQPKLQQRYQNLRGRQYYQQQGQRTQTPFLAQAQTDIAGARNVYQQTQSSLAGQEMAVKQQYGFEDTTNPYSQAALLQQRYQQQRAGTFNQAAGAGQLYSGSTQTALDQTTRDYGQSLDQSQRAYQAALADIANKRTEASNTRTGAIQQAKASALQNALNQPVDPTLGARPPGYARSYVQNQRQKAQKLQKHGHKARATAIRERLSTYY